MGRANTIVLSPTMTFEEKQFRTDETQIRIKKEWRPEFSAGRSVFTETGISRWKFWRKPRKLIIVDEGATRAFEYNPNPGGLLPRYWTLEDAKKFVAHMIAKTKGQQKPFSNWQVIGIIGAIAFVAILQLIVIRNTGGFNF